MMTRKLALSAALLLSLTTGVSCADQGKTKTTTDKTEARKTSQRTGPKPIKMVKEEPKPIVKPVPKSAADIAGKTTITTEGADGTTLTADLYAIGKANAPMIFLYHQAGASRGEYLAIAPELNRLGYNCLALDARSGRGGKVWGNTDNETAKTFKSRQRFYTAKPDLEHCFAWSKELGFTGKTAIWGSSYSSALVLIIAGEGKYKPDAVLSFAPGEYLLTRKNEVVTHVPNVKVPTLITSPKREENQIAGFRKAAPKNVEFYIQNPGRHGSSALTMASDKDAIWAKVKAFLAQNLPLQ